MVGVESLTSNCIFFDALMISLFAQYSLCAAYPASKNARIFTDRSVEFGHYNCHFLPFRVLTIFQNILGKGILRRLDNNPILGVFEHLELKCCARRIK